MKLILKYFQIVLHTTDDELPFFDHISKELELEKITTNYPSHSYISTNLNTNRDPILNICLGSCRKKYPGYKRYICDDCYIDFARYNIDMDLIELNATKPSIIHSNTGEPFIKMLENIDVDYIRPEFDKIYSQLSMMLLS